MNREDEDRHDGEKRLAWRRRGEYALGMVIESAAVGVISLLALLVMYVIKVIVK
jgi:hypothetical protein